MFSGGSWLQPLTQQLTEEGLSTGDGRDARECICEILLIINFTGKMRSVEQKLWLNKVLGKFVEYFELA